MPIGLHPKGPARGVPIAERRVHDSAAPSGAWPDTAPGSHRGSSPAVHRLALGGLAALLGILYGPIAAGTLADCWRDENYSHGILIPLVVLVLMRLRHHDVLRVGPAAARRLAVLSWALLGAGVAGFVVGAAAAESFTLRASGVLVVVALAGVLGGPARLWRHGPALALLLAAIPLPYILYYRISFPMQLLSARLAASTLDLVGLDVVRAGNVFEVDGHALEVVGACSGIRSMMALVSVALAAAVAMRLGAARGTLLTLGALPVALAGNVLRLVVTALLVVWIGERAARGTLHDLVGILGFMVSVALLGGLLSLLGRKSHATHPAGRRDRWRWPSPHRLRGWAGELRVTSPRAAAIAALVIAVGGGYGTFLRAHVARPGAPPALDRLPLELGPLTGEDVPLDDEVLDKLQPTAFVFRRYHDAAAPSVGLYVAYYTDPREGAQVHSPHHCYPGAGWKILASESIPVRDTQGRTTRMQRLLVQKRDRRDVVVYWYDTRAGRTTSDVRLKLDLARAALLHAPQDAAFVRWSTPLDAGEDLDAATRRLLGAVAHGYGPISSSLPFGG